MKSIAICISVEKNQQPELFEYEKITRISGTHPSLTLAASTEERMQANKPISAIPLIEHENIIRRWSPSGERNEVGSKLSVQLLGMIGDLCGCRIEHVGNSADLFLKADREQDTHKGISKLEHVNKMMVSLPVGFGPSFTGLTLQRLSELHLSPVTNVSRSMK